LANLNVSAWPEMIEDLGLAEATEHNISDWLRIIDGWVNNYADALYRLGHVTLEHLLHTEDNVAKAFRKEIQLDSAPVPSTSTSQYPRLIKGEERKRQTKLGLWDRFQIADGFLPATARLSVALAIVAGVLGFSDMTGSNNLSIYNGLGTPVRVQISAEQGVTRDTGLIAPFSSTEMTLESSEKLAIKTLSEDNREIEQFKPALADHTQHYIYNVAAAGPLVQWTQVYGTATARPPVYLGAPRWTSVAVDVYFAEPPESVKTKGGGATRSVLTGVGAFEPEKILNIIPDKTEQEHVIAMHNQWDSPSSQYSKQWKTLGGFDEALEQPVPVATISPDSSKTQLTDGNNIVANKANESTKSARSGKKAKQRVRK
jgi:hypothetical protein